MLSSMSAYRYLAGSRKFFGLTGMVAAVGLVGGLTAAHAGAAIHSRPHRLPTVQAVKDQVHPATTPSNTLVYGGGPVITGKSKVYLIFWGTQWGTASTDSNGNLKFSHDTAGAAGRVQQLFKGLGTGGEQWSGVMTQYCSGVPSRSTSCPSGTVPHITYPTGGGTLAGV
jgi:serine protease